MAGANDIPDGNTEIATDFPAIVGMIARTCRWVHPDTFRQLPVWCPWTARGRPLYDKTWLRRRTNTRQATNQTVDKCEGNIAASQALVAALGVGRRKPPNWTVCHIWGYDDPAFATQGSIVQDPRYFSCVGNMVWLPTPLKGFTDAVPEIKTMLRTCAFYLYGWACEHKNAATQAASIRAGSIPTDYPMSWPAPGRANVLPLGTAPCTQAVVAEIRKRKECMKRLLADESLVYFPREEVREVLKFWRVSLETT